MKYEKAKELVMWIEKDGYRPKGEDGIVMGRVKNLLILGRDIPADLSVRLQKIYRSSAGDSVYQKREYIAKK